MFKAIQLLAIPSFVLLGSANASAAILLSKAVSKTDSFGDSQIGAAYNANAAITVTVNEEAGMMTFKSNGELSASATLFGSSKPILKAQANAEMVPGQWASGSASCFVIGKQIYSDSFQKPLSGESAMVLGSGSKSFSAALFTNEKLFWVGPVPVKLSISVKGKVGLDYAAKVSADTLSMQVTPSGEAYGSASASADIWFASAGVDANLAFLKVKMPNSGGLALQNASPLAIGYHFDSDLAVTTLGGKIALWVKIGWGKKYFLTILQSNGVSSILPLMHESGIFM